MLIKPVIVKLITVGWPRKLFTIKLDTMAEVSTGTSGKEDYQPQERIGFSTVRVGNHLYVWAGIHSDLLSSVHDSEEKKRTSSRIEMYDLTGAKWDWKHTTGNPPLGISGYCAVPIDDEIFYFGGWCGHDDCYHNSVYSLSVDTLQWREVSPTSIAEGHPLMKHYCGMVHVQLDGEHYLAVIGGGSSSSNNTPHQHGAQYRGGWNNEVHYFSLSQCQWITPQVIGDRPLPCAAFSLTSITNDSAIMFGGLTIKGPTNIVYIITFTGSSVEWKQIQRPNGSSEMWPGKRWDHSSALINTTTGPHLLVVGGSPNCDDCWLLSVDTGIWQDFTEYLPRSVTDRENHSLSVWNVTPSTVWIVEFGGRRGKSPISDTVVIELIDGTLYSKCQRAILSFYDDLKEMESFIPSCTLRDLRELKTAKDLLTTVNSTSVILNDIL